MAQLLSPWTILDLAMLIAPVVVAFATRARLARPGLVLGGAVLMAISGGFSLIKLAAFAFSTSDNLGLFTAFSTAAVFFTGILPLTGTLLMIFGATTKVTTAPVPGVHQQALPGQPISGLPASVPAPPAPPTWQQPTQR